jgi:hypothetical protein
MAGETPALMIRLCGSSARSAGSLPADGAERVGLLFDVDGKCLSTRVTNIADKEFSDTARSYLSPVLRHFVSPCTSPRSASLFRAIVNTGGRNPVPHRDHTTEGERWPSGTRNFAL